MDSKAKAAEVKKTVKKAATKTAAKIQEAVDSTKADVFVQFGGNEVAAKDVLTRVKEAYVAGGHKHSDIKSVQVYIKPEENAAFYVINAKEEGRVDLF